MTDITVTLPKALEEVETSVLIPNGVYEAELIKAEKRIGAAGDYINYTIQIYKDEKPISRCFEIISLAEQSLWKLKTLLIALGMKEPKGKKLNVSNTLNKRFLAEVIVGEYQQKKRNEIVDYFPFESPIVKGKEKETESSTVDDEEISFE